MLGSDVAAPVAVCDTAAPLRPHRNVVDRMAIAEGTTKLNEDFMTIPSQKGLTCRPDANGITHIQLAKISEFGLVEKISADDPPSTDSSLEAVALSASGRFCCKSPKRHRGQFFAKDRNKRQSPINATSDRLSESPVSLVHDGAPHVIIRSSRLWL
jgi:hypothetical protein